MSKVGIASVKLYIYKNRQTEDNPLHPSPAEFNIDQCPAAVR